MVDESSAALGFCVLAGIIRTSNNIKSVSLRRKEYRINLNGVAIGSKWSAASERHSAARIGAFVLPFMCSHSLAGACAFYVVHRAIGGANNAPFPTCGALRSGLCPCLALSKTLDQTSHLSHLQPYPNSIVFPYATISENLLVYAYQGLECAVSQTCTRSPSCCARQQAQDHLQEGLQRPIAVLLHHLATLWSPYRDAWLRSRCLACSNFYPFQFNA